MANTKNTGITLYNVENGVHYEASRILYVEPNDLYGKPNPDGMPLTPDYSDMCISVQLIGETYDRKRGAIPTVVSGSNDDKNLRKFSLSFERNNDDKDFVPSAEGIMQGVKYGEKIESMQQPQYLTVYYTDISYESYGKREIVEGLGVESIDIKFESNYTPTVVIKFVDVRGAGILGHEEANHVDEKLTRETIYSWFTTQPYPKFKLQVKGFFGRPVTFQLACSGAKARFNSQTGNFEWTATFIAYMWSLLTDIPFNYLIAAPFDYYYGKTYWDEHVNTPEWQLSNGTAPITLHAFMQKITGVLDNMSSSDSTMSEADIEHVQNIERHIGDLKNLRDHYNDLVNKLKGFGDKDNHIEIANPEEENKELRRKQMLLVMSKSADLQNENAGIAFMDMYNNLTSELKTYASNYPSDDISEMDNISISPRKSTITSYWNAKWNNNSQKAYLYYDKAYDKKWTGGAVTREHTTYTATTLQEILGYNFSSDPDQSYNSDNEENFVVKPNPNMAQYMYERIDKAKKETNIYGLWCIVNIGILAEKVESKIIDLETEKKDYVVSQSEIDNLKIEEYLTFKPSIYNVFKIMMCHLETFVHILFKVKERIDNEPDKRTLTSLGINDIEYTDYKSNEESYQIPAWPAVFNHGEDNDQNQFKDENIKYFAWVGDLSNNFEEQKAVEKFRAALMNTKDYEDTSLKPQRNNSVYFPITAHDIMLGTSPFDHVREISSKEQSSQYNLASLCGYLCLRGAEIFGIYHKPNNNSISDNMAELFGRMDAYNYFASVGKHPVREITELGATEGQLIEAIKKIATSTINEQTQNYTEKHEDGTEYFTFENFVDIKTPTYSHDTERHPMLLEDGNNYKYVHYYDKASHGLIPSVITSWDKSFVNRYFDDKEDSDGKIYFQPVGCKINDRNMININSCMYVANSDKISTGIDENNSGVYNNGLFKIITNPTIIERIHNDYKRIETPNFKVNNKEISSSVTDNLEGYINTYWKIKEDSYKDWFDGATHVLSKKIAEFGNIKLMDLTNIKAIPDFKANRSWVDLSNNNVTVIDNGNVKVNGEDKGIGDVCIQTSKIRFSNNRSREYVSLMGTEFYYSQNLQMQPIRNEDDYDPTDDYRSTRAKALLQLMTYSYAKKTPASLNTTDKTHGSVEEVPYALVALIGGLLWRRKFSNKYGIDPINWKGTSTPYIICSQDQNPTDYMPYMATTEAGQEEQRHLRIASKDDIESPHCYDYLIPNIKGTNDWVLESNMYKQFLDIFEDYVANYFIPLRDKCELKFRGVEDITYADGEKVTPWKFQEFVKDFKKHVTDTSFSEGCINGNPLYYLDTSIRKSYSYIITPGNRKISTNNTSLLLLYNETNAEVQRLLIEPYVKKCIILDNTGMARRSNNVAYGQKKDMENNIYFSKDIFSQYISAFINELNHIVSEEETAPNINENPRVPKVKDECIPIYYCLKNIWDKWLVNVNHEREFDIQEFFDKHFVFIDKWYRNIGDMLIVNCESMLKNFNAHKAGEKNFLSFISSITSNERCMFIPMSDYVGFSGNNNIDEDRIILGDMFRPIPYNNQPPIQQQNIFCVTYIGPPSSIVSETTLYRNDGFDIWSHNPSNGGSGFTADANKYFANKNDTKSLNLTGRYGYNVPSFGVSYAHQNQHLFKNINIDMSNPVETEQSLRAYHEIMKQGSRDEHKISFIGQDIFNVFTNYSYTCEVEMMGNAQIRPLMFFQLFNINLFRGTYMIYQIEHHIVAGNMTTRFKGMKMSKYSLPFNTQIITSLPLVGSQNDLGGNGYGNSMFIGEIGEIDVNLVANPKDHWNDSECNMSSNRNHQIMKEDLKHLFNQLYDEIEQLPENKDKETKWNICCTHSYRPKNATYGAPDSDHKYGMAMDLQIAHYKNGKRIDKTQDKVPNNNKIKQYTVSAIIYKLHLSQIRQALLEFNSLTEFKTQGANNMAMLHVSVNSTDPSDNKVQKHEIMVLNNGTGYGNMVHQYGKNNQGVRNFHTDAHSYFQQLAANAYFNNPKTFKTLFPNYGYADDSVVSEIFGKLAPAKVSQNDLFGYNRAEKVMGNCFSKFKVLLSEMCSKTGLDPNVFMMLAMEETGLDPRLMSPNPYLGLGFIQLLAITIQDILGRYADYKEYITNKPNGSKLLNNGKINNGLYWISDKTMEEWCDLLGCTKDKSKAGSVNVSDVTITESSLIEQFKIITKYIQYWKTIGKGDFNNPFALYGACLYGMDKQNAKSQPTYRTKNFSTLKKELQDKLKNRGCMSDQDKEILSKYSAKFNSFA